jgi:RHS repeat-associated protein
VLAVVSDKHLSQDVDANNKVDFYFADVISAQDYWPFGSVIAERQFVASWAGEYRYGFNGKEDDAETGWQDYGARIYNSNIGRWLSVDPLASNLPSFSPYVAFANNPIYYVDPDGRLFDDYYFRQYGSVDVVRTDDNTDRFFYVETSTESCIEGTGWLKFPSYQTVTRTVHLATLEKNNLGLVNLYNNNVGFRGISFDTPASNGPSNATNTSKLWTNPIIAGTILVAGHVWKSENPTENDMILHNSSTAQGGGHCAVIEGRVICGHQMGNNIDIGYIRQDQNGVMAETRINEDDIKVVSSC